MADEGVARVSRICPPDEPDAADAALSPASLPAATQIATTGQLGDETIGPPQGVDTHAVTSDSSLDPISIANLLKMPGIELVLRIVICEYSSL